jgi:hypothetical protein
MLSLVLKIRTFRTSQTRTYEANVLKGKEALGKRFDPTVYPALQNHEFEAVQYMLLYLIN